ncbi:hypothetical protein SK128_025796, partial [Halocaridina rubra]
MKDCKTESNEKNKTKKSPVTAHRDEKRDMSKDVSHVELSPTKRKARCVPISYKEPDDDEGLGPAVKGPFTKHMRDTRNSRERCGITTEVSQNPIRNSEIPENEVKTSVVSPNSQRQTRLGTLNSSGDVGISIRHKASKSSLLQAINKKKMIRLRSEMDARLRTKSCKEIPTRMNLRLKSRLLGKGKIKKNKIKLSWTAALKARIRAAELKAKKDSSKNLPKKKKKPPSDKPKLPPKSKKKTHSATGNQTHVSHDFLPHHDLSYSNYLVGDDSMFSLDDSSHMDLI